MSWRDLVGVVAPGVLEQARLTSQRLGELRVPHAVCGGVAVGVLGYPRATNRRTHDLQDLRALLRRGAIDARDALDWLYMLDASKAEDFSELVQEVVSESPGGGSGG